MHFDDMQDMRIEIERLKKVLRSIGYQARLYNVGRNCRHCTEIDKKVREALK